MKVFYALTLGITLLSPELALADEDCFQRGHECATGQHCVETYTNSETSGYGRSHCVADTPQSPAVPAPSNSPPADSQNPAPAKKELKKKASKKS